MILLCLTLLVVVIGIIIYIYDSIHYILFDSLLLLGIILSVVGGLILFLELLFLMLKPVDFIEFKSKYDTFKNTVLSADDIRDASITKEIIEINNKININKKMKDNIWIGIFYNEEISNLDLLSKEVK